MKKSLIFLLIFLSQICLAQTDEQIEDGCKYEYPSLVDIFKKGNCISKAKKERAISEAKQKKEDAARPCLSNKIPELEANLSKIIKSISSNDTLKEVGLKLESLGYKAEYVPSNINIKEKVAVFYLFTQCISDFDLLVNITEGEDKKLKSFSVWSENSPKGYPSGYLSQFHVDYASLRRSSEIERSKKPQSSSSTLTSGTNVVTNPCALNLSKQERLQALAKEGVVKQNSQNSYSAGRYSVSFYSDGSLMFCY